MRLLKTSQARTNLGRNDDFVLSNNLIHLIFHLLDFMTRLFTMLVVVKNVFNNFLSYRAITSASQHITVPFVQSFLERRKLESLVWNLRN